MFVPWLRPLVWKHLSLEAQILPDRFVEELMLPDSGAVS
jgi:hypothetical protein